MGVIMYMGSIYRCSCTVFSVILFIVLFRASISKADPDDAEELPWARRRQKRSRDQVEEEEEEDEG